MPIFRYQAFDNKGKETFGSIEAFGEGEVKDQLRSKGLLVFKVEKIDTENSLLNRVLSLFEGSVTNKTRIQFTHQLSILLHAGVTLLEAMSLLILQFDGYFKKVLGKIIEDLKGGIAFADSINKHPKIFSKVYVQLVRAGEASGNLEMVLDRMINFLERNEQVGNEINNAIRGPLGMFVMIVLVVIGAVTFIIPAIGKTLGQLGKKLPAITQFMMSLSEFIKNYWLFLIICFFVVIGLFFWWKRTEKGELQFHYLLLKIPIVSSLVKNRTVVQFSQTLGMLLEADVQISSALDIVNNIVDNAILRKTLKVARDEIIKEGKIAKHLKNTGIFPPVSNYMIQTGEEAGKLAEMLTRVGRDTEVELTESIDALVATISPILTVFVAAAVLIIVLSIFLPILELSDISGNI